MSRTAVNSACKVKSPLSGFFTTAVVLVCIFKLSSALYWIPKGINSNHFLHATMTNGGLQQS